MSLKLKDVIGFGIGVVSGVGLGLIIPNLINIKKEHKCKKILLDVTKRIKDRAEYYHKKGDAISACAIWGSYVDAVLSNTAQLMDVGLEDIVESADYVFNLDTECDYIFTILETLSSALNIFANEECYNKDKYVEVSKACNFILTEYGDILKEADYKRFESFLTTMNE